ncbi:MAG: DUF3151 domain-containing protein [Actinomycetes bacterium]|jgi:hypothetical protein|nr:DUF3151 domain-containing protein [Acidimicrobiia bacterium]
MSDVNFTPAGPPEVVLPDPDPALVAALEATSDLDGMRAVAAAHPAEPLAWASLGDAAREAGEPDITVYAYYRVGYHRGLDLLRKNGWKGTGYVRWGHPSNRGFLRCLRGLGEAAKWIGEDEEAERCAQFLSQLDPSL